jgi:hypothetical protein
MRGALRILITVTLHLGLLNASPSPFYNATALIQKLWRLPISEFNSYFSDLTRCYCNDRTALLNLEHCDRFVYHCQSLHHFLKNLSVNTIDNSLLYNELENEWHPNYVPLFSYWKEINFASYSQFYALYFDCLARLFVVAVHESWVNLLNEKYAHERTKAEQLHAQMSMVLERLNGSEYEERYSRQLARYYDLLSFSQSEKESIESKR